MKEFACTSIIDEPPLVLPSLLGFFFGRLPYRYLFLRADVSSTLCQPYKSAVRTRFGRIGKKGAVYATCFRDSRDGWGRVTFLGLCRPMGCRCAHWLKAWRLPCVRHHPDHDVVPPSSLEGCPQMHQTT